MCVFGSVHLSVWLSHSFTQCLFLLEGPLEEGGRETGFRDGSSAFC